MNLWKVVVEEEELPVQDRTVSVMRCDGAFTHALSSLAVTDPDLRESKKGALRLTERLGNLYDENKAIAMYFAYPETDMHRPTVKWLSWERFDTCFMNRRHFSTIFQR